MRFNYQIISNMYLYLYFNLTNILMFNRHIAFGDLFNYTNLSCSRGHWFQNIINIMQTRYSFVLTVLSIVAQLLFGYWLYTSYQLIDPNMYCPASGLDMYKFIVQSTDTVVLDCDPEQHPHRCNSTLI